MGIALPQLAPASEDRVSGAQVVDGSLKFDKTKVHFLEKTFSSAGNRKTWTWSGWFKRGTIPSSNNLWTAYNGSYSGLDNFGQIYTDAADGRIVLYQGGGAQYTSEARFRDHSGWYHIVISCDVTQSTYADRFKIYVNGVLNTSSSGTIAQNTNLAFNNNIKHYIGTSNGSAELLDGKMSQVYFIDGLALGPEYFGYTDSLTNTWRPKKYEGTFGTNGFYLPMDGNSPIGEDKSGNGNNWTPVNFGGSVSLDNPIVSGALPILNTDGGGNVARVGVRTDAYHANLVLALPLVGSANDISNSVNSGSTTKTVTNYNSNAVFSSTYSNFYNGSVQTSNANTGSADGSAKIIQVASSSDFAFSGDFTVETWIYATAIESYAAICGNFATVNDFYIEYSTERNLLVGFNNTGYSGSFTAVANVWKHIAVTRSGSTLKTFVDGIETSSHTASGSIAAQNFGVGGYYVRSRGFEGHIQDFRIYNGVAKYTSDFVVASTSPDILPDTPSGVSGSSKLAKVTDGAVSFDGSGDYLSGPSTDVFVSPAQYTIDGFIYLNSAPGNNAGEAIFDTGSGGSDPELNVMNNNGNIQLYESLSNNTNWNGGASYMGLKRWHYFKQTVNGSSATDAAATHKLYIDGKLGVSNTINLSSRSASSVFAIGARTNGSVEIDAFISNLRYRSVLDDSLTVPTAPLTNVTNTKLLCCQSNTSATAAAVTPGSITANGNAAATNFNPFTTDINAVRGQESGYATLNPLYMHSGTANTYSDGNLSFSSGANNGVSLVNMSMPEFGKWYIEFTDNGTTNGGFIGGIADPNQVFADFIGRTATGWAYQLHGSNAGTYNNDTLTNTGCINGYGNGTILNVAVDRDNGYVWFGVNGKFVNSGNPSTGTGFQYSNVPTTGDLMFGASTNSSDSAKINCGQKPFKFPPPDGFQPLNAANVRPETVIVRPDQYVGVTTYTGTTANPATINSENNFTPDFVWVKSRSNGESHALYDTVRGATYRLRSDTNGVQTTGGNELQSFIPGGFTTGNNGHIYYNGYTYVAWMWRAGGNKNTFNVDDVGYATAAAAGLTGGDIAPIGASVGTKQGFSIIKYTGNGQNSAQGIPHGLGKTPSFVITKALEATGDVMSWRCYHQSLGATKYIQLDTDDVAGAFTDWANTSPTSQYFYVGGTNNTQPANEPKDYISYMWSDVPGLQKFGIYTGNGNADGPFIELGFRPAVVIVKIATGSDDSWRIYDNQRNKFNPTNNRLLLDTTVVEGQSVPIDFLSNGFKLRDSNGAGNGSGNTYVYMAWAEAPSFNLYGGQSNSR